MCVGWAHYLEACIPSWDPAAVEDAGIVASLGVGVVGEGVSVGEERASHEGHEQEVVLAFVVVSAADHHECCGWIQAMEQSRTTSGRSSCYCWLRCLAAAAESVEVFQLLLVAALLHC